MQNLELAERMLAHLEAHPEELAMRLYGAVYECGTTACLAGHAMLQSGYSCTRMGMFYRPDGSVVECEPWEAEQLLGLASHERFPSDSSSDLFGVYPEHEAVTRLRGLVETERRNRNAPMGPVLP
jgi:hypothetical protein